MERAAALLIERTKSEYGAYKLLHPSISPATRDAELAPKGKEAVLLIRRENSLMRQIERTVRLLLLLGAGNQAPEEEPGNAHEVTARDARGPDPLSPGDFGTRRQLQHVWRKKTIKKKL